MVGRYAENKREEYSVQTTKGNLKENMFMQTHKSHLLTCQGVPHKAKGLVIGQIDKARELPSVIRRKHTLSCVIKTHTVLDSVVDDIVKTLTAIACFWCMNAVEENHSQGTPQQRQAQLPGGMQCISAAIALLRPLATAQYDKQKRNSDCCFFLPRPDASLSATYHICLPGLYR